MQRSHTRPRRMLTDWIEVVGADTLQDAELAWTAILAHHTMGASGWHHAGITRAELENLAWCASLHDHRSLHAEKAVGDMGVPVPRHFLALAERQHDDAEFRRLC